MKAKLSLNIFFLLLIASFAIYASEAPISMPTIDFSSKSLAELVEYSSTNNTEVLTPRSKQSFNDRFQSEIRERYNALLSGFSAYHAHPGVTPEQVAQAQQMPRMSIFIIVPAAERMQAAGSSEGPHGPGCMCSLLEQLEGSVQSAQAQAHPADADQTEDENSTGGLASFMQWFRTWKR